MKRVYFFGAGFSKAINGAYPTLVELTEIVVANFTKRHSGTAITNHLSTVPKIFQGNLELILSYLFSDWPWKTTTEQDLDISLYRHLTYEICEHLARLETTEINEEFKTLIFYLKTHQHGIITLNYDILPEQLAEIYWQPKTSTIAHNYDIVLEDCYDDVKRTSGTQPYDIEAIDKHPAPWISKRIYINRDFILKNANQDILKLVGDQRLDHKAGSTDRALISIQLEAYLNLVRRVETPRKLVTLNDNDPRSIRRRILKLHGSIDWIDEKSDTFRVPAIAGIRSEKAKLPHIVPPLLDKTRHYATPKLRDMWFSAHSLLEEADEVVIVGFSFPPTDLSVRLLFQSALKNNSSIRIVVVNRDLAENLKIAYEQVFCAASGTIMDYQYCGREDALIAYVKNEVIRDSVRATVLAA